MKLLQQAHRASLHTNSTRRGMVLVIAVVLMTAIMGIAALSIDLGYIFVIRDQMQTAVDAAALAAAAELGDGYGAGASRTQAEIVNLGQTAGQTVAASNRMLDRPSAYLSPSRDLVFGKRVYNSSTQMWSYQWGNGPYDCVKATIHRDQPPPPVGSGITAPPDGSLNLLFARVLGHKNSSMKSSAVAALKPGVGVRLLAGGSSAVTLKILPIALDQQTWANLIANTGSVQFADDYSYDPDSGLATKGADGILEVNIYPYGSSNLPPGNRGTVDIGSPNNSTADLSRQIRYGQNAYDMSFFPNSELRFDNGPMILNGDTGISAGIKDDLASIIGQPRLMPLFTSVAGPGNNAMYTIPKLVGIRIVFVQLTGSPSQKQVIVQPATVVTSQAITSNSEQIATDSFFGPVRLVQ
ncbi:MAG: hypothetical protein JWM11_5338 [Planctomycetaceae bacterium]|nr:hypothetical protein [Planctomycetaceae bacterium]